MFVMPAFDPHQSGDAAAKGLIGVPLQAY